MCMTLPNAGLGLCRTRGGELAPFKRTTRRQKRARTRVASVQGRRALAKCQ